MRVLGIETATDVCSVGIVAGDSVVERSVRESRIHSEKLIVLLQEVLREAHLEWRDIDGVALSGGPGSFTGLRIGASAVKGLLSAGAKPFVLVPTFEGIQESYRQNDGSREEFVVCLDAKQDEWYVQEAGTGSSPKPLSVMDTARVMGLLAGRLVITDVPDRFRTSSEVSDIRSWCHGGTVAAIGRERLRRGIEDDVRAFEPTYWKEFVVRTTQKAVTPQREAKET